MSCRRAAWLRSSRAVAGRPSAAAVPSKSASARRAPWRPWGFAPATRAVEPRQVLPARRRRHRDQRVHGPRGADDARHPRVPGRGEERAQLAREVLLQTLYLAVRRRVADEEALGEAGGAEGEAAQPER